MKAEVWTARLPRPEIKNIHPGNTSYLIHNPDETEVLSSLEKQTKRIRTPLTSKIPEARKKEKEELKQQFAAFDPNLKEELQTALQSDPELPDLMKPALSNFTLAICMQGGKDFLPTHPDGMHNFNTVMNSIDTFLLQYRPDLVTYAVMQTYHISHDAAVRQVTGKRKIWERKKDLYAINYASFLNEFEKGNPEQTPVQPIIKEVIDEVRSQMNKRQEALHTGEKLFQPATVKTSAQEITEHLKVDTHEDAMMRVQTLDAALREVTETEAIQKRRLVVRIAQKIGKHIPLINRTGPALEKMRTKKNELTDKIPIINRITPSWQEMRVLKKTDAWRTLTDNLALHPKVAQELIETLLDFRMRYDRQISKDHAQFSYLAFENVANHYPRRALRWISPRLPDSFGNDFPVLAELLRDRNLKYILDKLTNVNPADSPALFSPDMVRAIEGKIDVDQQEQFFKPHGRRNLHRKAVGQFFERKIIEGRPFGVGRAKDKFAYWIVQRWPRERPINPVELGIMSSLRPELGLTEGDLPNKDSNKQLIQLMERHVDALLDPQTGTVRQLENQAAKIFGSFAYQNFDRYKKKFRRYYTKKYRVELKKTKTKKISDETLRIHMLQESIQDPFNLYSALYLTSRRTDAFEFGQRVAESYKEVVAEPSLSPITTLSRTLGESNRDKIIEDVYGSKNSFAQLLEQRKMDTDGRPAGNKNWAEDFYKNDKPKSKFAYWVINRWKEVFPEAKDYDRMTIGILYSLRKEMGLDEASLPRYVDEKSKQIMDDRLRQAATLTQSLRLYATPAMSEFFIERMAEYGDKIDAFFQKYDVKDLPANMKAAQKAAVLVVLLKLNPQCNADFFDTFIRKNPYISSFEIGRVIGTAIKESIKDIKEERSTFQTAQEKQRKIFEQMQNGEYKKREKVSDRSHTALARISHWRRRIDEDTVTQEADQRVHKSKKRAIWKRIQAATTEVEGKSIFRNSDHVLKKTFVGASMGLVAARTYAWWQNNLQEKIYRPIQLLGLAGGLILGRADRNVIKNIRWKTLTKAGIRGVAAVTAMGLIEAGMQHFNILPPSTDLGSLLHLPFTLTLSNFLASNMMTGLGFNYGSEWAVNKYVNRKDGLNELSEFLFFKDRDRNRAEFLYNQEARRPPGEHLYTIQKKFPPVVRAQSWKELADFTLNPDAVDTQEGLLQAARQIKQAKETQMALMVYNPTRFSKRYITLQNQQYEIDNNEFLDQLYDLEQKLYTETGRRFPQATNELLSILQYESEDELPDIIKKKISKTRWTMFLAGNTLRFAALAGSSIQFLRLIVTDVGEFMLDKSTALLPHTPIALSQFVPNRSDVFSIDETTSYIDKATKLNQSFSAIQKIATIYTDSSTSPETQKELEATYHFTSDQLQAYLQTLKDNGLSSTQDLTIITQLAATIPDDIGSDKVTNFIAKTVDQLNGKEYDDLGSVMATITDYKDALRQALKSLITLHNYDTALFSFSEQPGGDHLLRALGVDVNSLDYQLKLGTITPDRAQEILNVSKSALYVEPTATDPLIIIRNPDTGDFVGRLPPETGDDAKKITLQSLSLIQRLLSDNITDSDLKLALNHPKFGYATFLAEIQGNNINMDWLPAQIDSTHQFDFDTLNDDLYSLIRKSILELPNKPEELVLDQHMLAALKGDPQAYNWLTQYMDKVKGVNGAHLADTFQKYGYYYRYEPLSLALDRAQDRPEIIDRIRLSRDYFGGLRSVLEIQPPPELPLNPTLPDFNLKQLLAGESSLQDSVERLLNHYPTVSVYEGRVIGQFRDVLHESLTAQNYDPHILDLYNNIEGPTHSSPEEFLKLIIGRNALAAVGKGVPSGASDPAMQLMELIAGGLNQDSTLGPSGSDIPKFFHYDNYNFDYLVKLVNASVHNQVPYEMNDVMGLPALPIGGSNALTQLLNKDTITPDTINKLCAKLEVYIASRRLLSVFGQKEVLSTALDFSPFGNTEEGVPIFGLEAAARYYFGATASLNPTDPSLPRLTDAQAIYLIGKIQGPSNYSSFIPLTDHQINDLGFTDPEQKVRERAIAVITMFRDKKQTIDESQALQLMAQISTDDIFVNLMVKHKYITQDEANYLLDNLKSGKIPTIKPLNQIPQEWLNQLPEGVVLPDKAPTMYNLPGIRVLDYGGDNPANIASVLESMTNENNSSAMQDKFKALYDSLIPTPDQAGTDPIINIKLPTGPFKDVQVPVFEEPVQLADGTMGKVRYPGMAVSIFKSTGQEEVLVDPGNMLSQQYVETSSTIKPLLVSFLLSTGEYTPDSEFTNLRGAQVALDGSNLPVFNAEGIPYTQKMSLANALLVSANVPMQAALKDYLDRHGPIGWLKFQDYLSKFGLTLTDKLGNKLLKPTAYAAFGGDSCVKLQSLALAYAKFGDPTKLFNSETLTTEQSNIINAVNTARSILADDAKRKVAGKLGLGMNDLGMKILSSKPDDNGDYVIMFKTGTGGGIDMNNANEEYTQRLLTAFIVIKPNGEVYGGAGLMVGQTIDEKGNAVITNLDREMKWPWARLSIAPILRYFTSFLGNDTLTPPTLTSRDALQLAASELQPRP